MSLIQHLKKKDKHIDLTYYGNNDIATGFEMNRIVEEKVEIISFYSTHHDMGIDTLEDYIVYHYALKISNMEEIIPNIIDEGKKESFQEIVNIANGYLDTIKKGKLIKFINQNYEKLFIQHDDCYGLADVTLLIIQQYMGGISDDVITHIILQHGYLVISRYDIFCVAIEKSDARINLLLQDDVISDLFCQKQKSVQKVLLRLHQKGMLSGREHVIECLAKIVEEKYSSIDDDNILANEAYVRKFVEFLSAIKHVKANQFKEYYETVEKKMDDYLKRRGQCSTFEIPVGKIMDYLKGIKDWEYRLLFVSHEIKQDKICSRLDFESEGRRNLIDFVSTNHTEDEYYTPSHIHKLEIGVVIGQSTVQGILFDEELFEQSKHCFLGYIGSICELQQWDKKDYYEDVQILFQMLDVCRQMKNVENIHFEKGICYGVCTHMCGLMEKILRSIYVNENKDFIYLDESQITLGQLLRNDAGTMGEIFGKYHLKHLRYYLSTDTEKKIGMNHRNELDHYTIDKRRLNITFVSKLLYFLIDVLNSVFLYVQPSEEK